MKKLKVLLGLTVLLIIVACKNESVAQVQILAPQQFHQAMLENKDVQVIDVRTSAEFAQGHLVNARNMDVLEANFIAETEKLNPEKPIYIYCRSGKRSARAASILEKADFKKIYDLEGGFLQWEENQLPTE